MVIAERNVDKGREVAEQFARAGHAITHLVPTDVANADDFQRLMEETLRTLGRLDVLVNNAAVFPTIKMKPFWELTEVEWDSLMAVNLKGVWLASRAAFGPMPEQGGGSIVNIASSVVFIGRPNYLHYVASKAGVVGMTRALAKEAGPYHIRVIAVTPGATYTEIPRETVSPEQKAAMVQQQCVARPEEPGDLVGTVCFLASEESAFISGQTINVDGGLAFH